MQTKPKIAVFDSGVGGLTIFESLKRALPDCDYVYASDSENLPYGTKPDDVIKNLATTFCKNFVEKENPQILVVACNTASVVALEEIRSAVKCHVVGVVPAIKPAAKISNSKVIGLLATPATIKRAYTDKLIAEFASDCLVVRVGSGRLVEIAEMKLKNEKISLKEIREEIKGLFVKDLDVVVMGCTHFPHLLDEFKQVFPIEVTWLDSSEAIARRVANLLLLEITPTA